MSGAIYDKSPQQKASFSETKSSNSWTFGIQTPGAEFFCPGSDMGEGWWRSTAASVEAFVK